MVCDNNVPGAPSSSVNSGPCKTLSGAIQSTTDLLGRTVRYSDVWGNITTTTYDPTGQVTIAGPNGTQTYNYDTAGRVLRQTLNGATLALLRYDSAGRLAQSSYPNGPGAAANGSNSIDYSSPGTRDALGRLTTTGWQLPGPTGTVSTTDVVTRSQSGIITNETVDNHDPNGSPDNYQYDLAGRLIHADISGDPNGTPVVADQSYDYTFQTPNAACGTGNAAGRNTNRTAMCAGPTGGTKTTTTYSYDANDRLVSTSPAGVASSDTYDSHGNTASFTYTVSAGTTGTVTYGYDINNRHLSTSQGSTNVTFTLDATDRIVARNETSSGGTNSRFAYTGPGDGAAFVTYQTSNGVKFESRVAVAGGPSLTLRPNANNPDTQLWSYPNGHGDITRTLTTTSTGGVVTNTIGYTAYGPYGEFLPGSPLPDNRRGNLDDGWLGGQHKATDHTPGLPVIIEMGARMYNPTTGRFLEVDPIEGGSANDYDYCRANPIDCKDLDGTIADGGYDWKGRAGKERTYSYSWEVESPWFNPLGPFASGRGCFRSPCGGALLACLRTHDHCLPSPSTGVRAKLKAVVTVHVEHTIHYTVTEEKISYRVKTQMGFGIGPIQVWDPFGTAEEVSEEQHLYYVCTLTVGTKC